MQNGIADSFAQMLAMNRVSTFHGAFVVIPEISLCDISGIIKNGAEDEIRTRDPRLGKAMLYP